VDRPQSRNERPGGERRLGRYELVTPVGKTALGGLFRGRIAFGADKGHEVLVRRVQKGQGNDDATLQAIREAASEVGEVRHASVAGILEARLGTSLVVATEHAEGVPLRSVMNAARRRGTPLAPAVSLRIIVELLRTMAAAAGALEAAGLTRPLLGVCPDAALVGEGGTVVVTDLALWTLARPPRNPDLMAYRAPEQLGALAEGDSRSELFSVGVMWWELLANRTLFGGENQAAVWQRVRQGSIAPPSGVADDVRALVMTLLDRNPDARLRSVDEVMSVIPELGADHIADWDQASRALGELTDSIERGEFPSVAPPPDLGSRPPRSPRATAHGAGAKPTPKAAAQTEAAAAKRAPDGVAKPVASVATAPKPAGETLPKRAALAPSAKSLRPVPRPATSKASGASPRRSTSSDTLAAARPSSFAPAPLPQDIPDEDDWGGAEEVSDQDLTSLRPDAADGVDLSDLDLESLPPAEAPRRKEAPVGAPKPGPKVPRLQVPRPSESAGGPPVHAASMGPLPVSQRPTKELETDALPAAVQAIRDQSPSPGSEPEPAGEAAAPQTDQPKVAKPEPQGDPEEAAVGRSEPAGRAFPSFASEEERPVEETLGEVLRDAAAGPIAASGLEAEQVPQSPAAADAAAPGIGELPTMPRSPMASEDDEGARISAIENNAAVVREGRRPVAMPADHEGRARAAQQPSSGWRAPLIVAGVFVVTFVATFFGFRAVLLAPGSREVLPPPRPSMPASAARPAPTRAPSATPAVTPAVSASPRTSAEVAVPESPPTDLKPALAREPAVVEPPAPTGTTRSSASAPSSDAAAPALEPPAPETPPAASSSPPGAEPLVPEDDPYG
jgi:serine/threonine protein kinase